MPERQTTISKEPLAQVFHKSVSPYSKALSLHPHLYGGELYNRASELKALDRIVTHLRVVADEAKQKKYSNIRPILEAIKDALSGNPKLSWWNLMTISIGHAFSQADDDDYKNMQEKAYLSEISQTLTEIIRTYYSTNTKLLLEIRLTTMEVDSRLIELEKIPGHTKESSETQEYLTSEFRLIDRELDNLSTIPPAKWNENLGNLLTLIRKVNQLMQILESLKVSNPEAYALFCRKDHLQNLSLKMASVIEKCRLIPSDEGMAFWDAANLNEFFNLISNFSGIVDRIQLSDLTTLLIQLENQLVNDPEASKETPPIFSSPVLMQVIIQKDAQAAKLCEQVRAAVRAKKEHTLIRDPLNFFRTALMGENDLHNLCSMARFSPQESSRQPKSPSQIQRECVLRMKTLAHCSQPKDLEKVLNSFTVEEMAIRYYLLQEAILEQFIYWRKNGIF